MNSELYLNGAHVRSQPYGYSTFVVDVTPQLNRTLGGANVLALRVANSGRNSRWFRLTLALTPTPTPTPPPTPTPTLTPTLTPTPTLGSAARASSAT